MELEKEGVYWKVGDDLYKVQVFTREELPGASGHYGRRKEVFSGEVDFETLERLMADQPETRWAHVPPLDPNDKSRVYAMSEPEFVGKIPVRTELTVLSADDPKALELGFMIHECRGGPDIYAAPAGLTIEEVREQVGGMFKSDEFKLEPITDEQGIDEGSVILVQSFGGMFVATVKRSDDGKLYFHNGQHTTGMLVWTVCKDCPPGRQNRWSNPAQFNTKGLKRTELER